ncbi:hypothetical protein GCM10011360_27350 [Primorskyibacter flagellatus]|uniref:Orotidine 5'-phosphate decarboxylase n=1 Tax=Primorskyibacter flagellatus TaxID=1387277 RepID=A0A917ACC6_9RHOB|nr:hypothetical protein [Primorskyibacter flagellatus]GGE38083.1 hypothetical protein GCM10011360_27350 [Primorskyibacter flagellatus]
MTTTRIQNITYNPATRAFEARVTLRHADEDYTYPCALRAPIDTDSGIVARRLIEMAERRHARDASEMRSRRPANLLSHVPAEIASATDMLWQRMLGHAA